MGAGCAARFKGPDRARRPRPRTPAGRPVIRWPHDQRAGFDSPACHQILHEHECRTASLAADLLTALAHRGGGGILGGGRLPRPLAIRRNVGRLGRNRGVHGAHAGPGAPGCAVWASLYAVGRRTGRTQAFRRWGQSSFSSMLASCAVSRSGAGVIVAGTDGSASRRNRRFRPLRTPPRRPMAPHWSMVLLWNGLPNSRFMAPQVIDRVAPNLKWHFAPRRRFTRTAGTAL